MLFPRNTFLSLTLCLAVGTSVYAQRSPRAAERAALIEQAEAARDSGDHASAVELALRAGQIQMSTSLRWLIAEENVALMSGPGGAIHRRESCVMALACMQEATAATARTLPDRERILRACTAITARTCAVDSDSGVPAVPRVEADVPPTADRPEVLVVDASSDAEPTSDVPNPLPDAPPISSGRGAGPWVLMGVGGGALIASAVFAGLFAQATEDRHAACSHNTATNVDECEVGTPAEIAARGRYEAQMLSSRVGWTAFGVGTALVVGGVLWRLLASDGQDPTRRTTFRWNVAPLAGGAIAGFEGVW